MNIDARTQYYFAENHDQLIENEKRLKVFLGLLILELTFRGATSTFAGGGAKYYFVMIWGAGVGETL